MGWRRLQILDANAEFGSFAQVAMAHRRQVQKRVVQFLPLNVCPDKNRTLCHPRVIFRCALGSEPRVHVLNQAANFRDDLFLGSTLISFTMPNSGGICTRFSVPSTTESSPVRSFINKQ